MMKKIKQGPLEPYALHLIIQKLSIQTLKKNKKKFFTSAIQHGWKMCHEKLFF
jgi:hypothetical protein